MERQSLSHRSIVPFALLWQSYQLPVPSSLSSSPFHNLLPSLNASCILSSSTFSWLLPSQLKSATHFVAIKFAMCTDRWNNQWSLGISMGMYTKRVIEKCRGIYFIRQTARERGGSVCEVESRSWQPNRFVYLYFMLYLDIFHERVECNPALTLLSNTSLPLLQADGHWKRKLRTSSAD